MDTYYIDFLLLAFACEQAIMRMERTSAHFFCYGAIGVGLYEFSRRETSSDSLCKCLEAMDPDRFQRFR